MEEEQVRVLQRHTRDIVDGIHMEEKLLSAFLEKDVFTLTMVDMIRAKHTQSEKLYELMYLLPKRGPGAFSNFIEIIREDYEWLAHKLSESYEEEMKMHVTLNNQTGTNSARHHMSRSSPSTPGTTTTRSSSPMSVSTPGTTTGSSHKEPLLCSPGVSQRSLNQLYMKLKARNSVSSYRRGNTQLSVGTPEPATFKMVDCQVEDLFERMEELEEVLKRVNRILEVKNLFEDPVSHIVDLQLAKRHLERELRSKDLQKNKYCDRIYKLESSCRDLSSKVERSEKEIKRLKESLKQVRRESEEKTELVESQRKGMDELQNLNQQLMVASDSQREKVTEMTEALETLEEENESLQTLNTEMTQTVKKLKSENFRLKQVAKQPYLQAPTGKYQHHVARKPVEHRNHDNQQAGHNAHSNAQSGKPMESFGLQIGNSLTPKNTLQDGSKEPPSMDSHIKGRKQSMDVLHSPKGRELYRRLQKYNGVKPSNTRQKGHHRS